MSVPRVPVECLATMIAKDSCRMARAQAVQRLIMQRRKIPHSALHTVSEDKSMCDAISPVGALVLGIPQSFPIRLLWLCSALGVWPASRCGERVNPKVAPSGHPVAKVAPSGHPVDDHSHGARWVPFTQWSENSAVGWHPVEREQLRVRLKREREAPARSVHLCEPRSRTLSLRLE